MKCTNGSTDALRLSVGGRLTRTHVGRRPVNSADVDGDAWGILIRLVSPVSCGLKAVFGAGVAKVTTKAATAQPAWCGMTCKFGGLRAPWGGSRRCADTAADAARLFPCCSS